VQSYPEMSLLYQWCKRIFFGEFKL